MRKQKKENIFFPQSITLHRKKGVDLGENGQ